MAPEELPIEAIGEDELERPQPANEPLSEEKSEDLFQTLQKTITRLEEDQPARRSEDSLSYPSGVAVRFLSFSTLSQTAKGDHFWVSSHLRRSP